MELDKPKSCKLGTGTCFKNLDISLDVKMKDSHSSVGYNLKELYKLLNKIPIFLELGGFYKSLDAPALPLSAERVYNNFTIIPEISYLDKNSLKPGISIESISSKILWHSHPFNQDYVSYPSKEDLEFVKKYPNTISLLVCKFGIYVLGVVNKKFNVNDFYNAINSKNKELLSKEEIYRKDVKENMYHYINQELFMNSKFNSKEIYIKFISLLDLSIDKINSEIDNLIYIRKFNAQPILH